MQTQESLQCKFTPKENQDLKENPYNKIVIVCLTCREKFQSKKTCKNKIPKYCSRQCYANSLKGKFPTEKQLYILKIGRTFPHTNKGSHWSEEAKLKFSKKKRGVKLTIEHKISLSLAKKGKPIKHFIKRWEDIKKKISQSLRGKPQKWNRGEKHPNWQGGKTPLNSQIRNSFEMKEWRRKIFERDDYICQICRKKSGRLVADHIKPFALYPKLRFDIDNGRTICKECDLESDTYGGRAIKFNDLLQKAEKLIN